MAEDGRKRRLAFATLLYAVTVGVYFAVVPRSRILEHTPFNHFALLADGWLHHRLTLDGMPPAYAQNNDFASFGGKWFIVFPPFPAVLLVPFVWWAKNVEKVRDGQLFIWLSGIGPAVFFLALEKLRLTGRSGRTFRDDVVLTLLLAFGTVYFFTSVQGTVWFAAHVVGVGIGALYLLCALDAEHPALSGLLLGLGFLTRTPLLFAFPLFLLEAVRVTSTDRARLIRLLVRFSLPLAACFAIAMVHNEARFGKPLDFGYEYLTVAWQARMKRWGLFNYHFLARNLGVVLTGLPFWDGKARVPLTINLHGLALWLTTPLFLYLVWPKKVGDVARALYVTAAAVAIPGLFYQNTGWMQFGYRFSNDYAVFLVALLAVTGHEFKKLFYAGFVWSVAVNAFGAKTFDNGDLRKFYYEDASQRTFYQPD
ncbi:MAG TPA: hypothetical protein VHE30_29850 [Polyangiaceae bacterium]|nr:hypothetical protein [Polyangiaceae bacterium]